MYYVGMYTIKKFHTKEITQKSKTLNIKLIHVNTSLHKNDIRDLIYKKGTLQQKNFA